jgi:hypothetical protein
VPKIWAIERVSFREEINKKEKVRKEGRKKERDKRKVVNGCGR